MLQLSEPVQPLLLAAFQLFSKSVVIFARLVLVVLAIVYSYPHSKARTQKGLFAYIHHYRQKNPDLFHVVLWTVFFSGWSHIISKDHNMEIWRTQILWGICWNFRDDRSSLIHYIAHKNKTISMGTHTEKLRQQFLQQLILAISIQLMNAKMEHTG